MATKDFEVQQLLKAYRKGLISDELFEAQMKDLGEANGALDVANVLAHRGDGSKIAAQVLQKTPQSETMVFTIPANMAGIPGLALPCGFSASGLPLSLQLSGRPFAEALVLRVGHAYEQATTWHTRRPPV